MVYEGEGSSVPPGIKIGEDLLEASESPLNSELWIKDESPSSSPSHDESNQLLVPIREKAILLSSPIKEAYNSKQKETEPKDHKQPGSQTAKGKALQCTRCCSVISRRVTGRQRELLWEYLDSHRNIAVAYNRSLQAKEYAKRKWMAVAKILNSQGEGTHKDWKGWSKYWVDYKAKLKRRAAAVRSSHLRTGGGPFSEPPLIEIEKKFLHILGEDFGQGLAGVRVEPVAELSENTATAEKDEDSSSNLTLPPEIHMPILIKEEPIAPIDPKVQPAAAAADPVAATPTAANPAAAFPATAGAVRSARKRTREPCMTARRSPVKSSRQSAAVVANLVAANPAATDTSAASPVATNLVAANPVVANPVTTYSIAANPVTANPAATNLSPNPAPVDSIAATPAAATPAAATPAKAEYIQRRKRRREPFMTEQAARRALVESSRRSAAAAVRGVRALEEIGRALINMQQTLDSIQRTFNAAFPRAAQQERPK